MTSPKNLNDLIREIDDPRQPVLSRIYDDLRAVFHHAAGSGHNHQAWHGGYADHIAECLRINDITYDALSTLRPLPFTKASAAIALFFHDIEKPFRYGPEENKLCKEWQQRVSHDWEAAKWDILQSLQKTYGFTFSDEEINALRYTHGEGKDHQKGKRVALPLAAHVHHCDNTSARIWHDHGRGLS